MLLSQIEGSGSGVKRVPSYVAPDLAADIRRHFSSTLRQRKGHFPCNFVTEFPTFALPAGMSKKQQSKPLLICILHYRSWGTAWSCTGTVVYWTTG